MSYAINYYVAMINEIKNCPIVGQDIKLMNDILGKRKVVRGQPDLDEIDIVQLPKSILGHYNKLILCVGVMHVN